MPRAQTDTLPSEGAGGGDIRRIFFALWPDEGLRERMSESVPPRERRRGKPVPLANLHLTLAFVGNVEAAALACMEEAAADIEAPPFSLRLDRLGSFPRAGVLWLGCSETPEPLQTLAAALQAALEPCGYRPEQRPFAAHVTVARKYRRALRPQFVPAVEWPVAAFTLVDSRLEPDGARYSAVRHFPLCGPGGDSRP